MNIEINNTTDKLNYFTLTDDNENSYEWHLDSSVEINEEVSGYLLDQIRQREYPGADLGEMTWDEWIKAGCINHEISEEYTEQVTPAVFALNNDDPVMLDRRVEERRVDPFLVYLDPDDPKELPEHWNSERRVEDRRQLTPELLQPAMFETKTRVIRPKRVIEKVAWKSTHPVTSRIIDGKKISKDTLNKLDSATTIAKMKEVLKTILLGNS